MFGNKKYFEEIIFYIDSGNNQALQNSGTSSVALSPSEAPQRGAVLSSNQHGGMYICITF